MSSLLRRYRRDILKIADDGIAAMEQAMIYMSLSEGRLIKDFDIFSDSIGFRKTSLSLSIRNAMQ